MPKMSGYMVKLRKWNLFWVMLYTWTAYIRAENGIFIYPEIGVMGQVKDLLAEHILVWCDYNAETWCVVFQNESACFARTRDEIIALVKEKRREK